MPGFMRFGLKPIRNYRVDYFFIDFAFPDKKVGIEIDSFMWHKDTDRDKRRHDYIKSKGWKLYHIPAKLSLTNPMIPAAFIYLKHYGENSELIKVAKFEIYKITKHNMTDSERIKVSFDFALDNDKRLS